MTGHEGGTPPALRHPVLRQVAEILAERPGALAADDGAPARAAVLLTLRATPADTVELLLIQRAHREGDPWSGQVALPGGRRAPEDPSLRDTALRETWEETGLDLVHSGVVVGTLDELRPRTPTLPPIIVTPFVAVLTAPALLVPNHEVADAFWVPLDRLRDPDVSQETRVEVRGAIWRVPAFVVGGHVVWGMTERIVRQFLSLLADRDLASGG